MSLESLKTYACVPSSLLQRTFETIYFDGQITLTSTKTCRRRHVKALANILD
jgi:hypothetical protein